MYDKINRHQRILRKVEVTDNTVASEKGESKKY